MLRSRATFTAVWCAVFAGAVTLLATAGCDDRSSAPPPPQAHSNNPTDDPNAPQPPPKTERPTTQELLSGPRAPIALKAIPFTVEAPKGWSIESHAGLIVLEGPTPAGTAQIHVSRHTPPIAQHGERLIDGAKKDVTIDPSPLNRAEVRKLGEIQVLDYRKLGKPMDAPAIDSTGKEIAPKGTRLTWKITAMVPTNRTIPGNSKGEKEIQLCELSFVDLTREQYEIDKELLEKIVASLKYDPSAVAN